MRSIIFLFILQAIVNGGVNLAGDERYREEYKHSCRGGDFKTISLKKNKDAALDKIAASLKNNNSIHNGFYQTQVGNKPEEQVTAMLLCNPNAVKGLCECCFNTMRQQLLKYCPKQSEVVFWDFHPFLTCMLRYSTGRKILSVLDDWAWYDLPDMYHVKTVNLGKTLDGLVSKLKEKVAGVDGPKKFALASQNYDGNELSLFVGMQCTGDLSKGDCVKCLSKASVRMTSCCSGKPLFSGRVISTNCYMWYRHVSFFNPPKDYDAKACG